MYVAPPGIDSLPGVPPTPNGRLVCPVLEFLLCESRENTGGHKTIGKEIVGLVLDRKRKLADIAQAFKGSSTDKEGKGVQCVCRHGGQLQGFGPRCNEQEGFGLSEESPVSTLLQPTKKENVFSEQGLCARLSVAPAPVECQATAPSAGVHQQQVHHKVLSGSETHWNLVTRNT